MLCYSITIILNEEVVMDTKLGTYEVTYAVHESDDDFRGHVAETWRQNGVLHRENGPAVTVKGDNGGIYEEYYSHGKLHRDDGPARYSKFVVGGGSKEEWFQNDVLHREGGPAESMIDGETGVVLMEYWVQNGVLHREDGPAVTYRDEKSYIEEFKRWAINGKNHRDSGPAIIERDPETGVTVAEEHYRDGLLHNTGSRAALIHRDCDTGLTVQKQWYKKGVLHNNFGPAEETNSASGGNLSQKFYQHGSEVPKPENVREWVKENSTLEP
jgi:hypothetical protein